MTGPQPHSDALHIVHYISRIELAAGGVVRAVLDMAELAASAGHRVTVITGDDTDAPDAWRKVPDRLVAVHTSAGGRISRNSIATVRVVIERADTLHLHTPWDPANLQLAKLARAAHKPYIVTIHGMLDDWCMTQRGLKKKLYLALAAKKLLERAAYVHCSAQAELDQSKKWFPNGRGIIVPNLLAMDEYQTLPGIDRARARWTYLDTDQPVLLFLSRIHEKKGIEHLINAVSVLRSRGMNPVVVVAGTGDAHYTDSLVALAKQIGAADDVHFVGHVGGADKLSLYQAADLFVLPTSQENFGFVYFESLACETPIVTTRGTDTWPDLEHSGAAKITHPLTSDTLADDVEHMLADRDALRLAGKKGRDWVFEYLDEQRILEQYDLMYR